MQYVLYTVVHNYNFNSTLPWKLRAYALSAIRYLSHENSTHALISFHLASSSSREIISSRARSISFHLVESRALRIAIQIAIASNREIADSSRFHLARSRFISRDQRHLVISRDHLVLSRLSFSVTHTLSPKDNLVGDARSFQVHKTYLKQEKKSRSTNSVLNHCKFAQCILDLGTSRVPKNR